MIDYDITVHSLPNNDKFNFEQHKVIYKSYWMFVAFLYRKSRMNCRQEIHLRRDLNQKCIKNLLAKRIFGLIYIAHINANKAEVGEWQGGGRFHI